MSVHLTFDNIGFRYRPNFPWVLEGFSHRFSPGVHLVKGFSGCGKSTLLRLAAGYLLPSRGRVCVPPTGSDPDALFQRGYLGFVFQQMNLLPLASLERNLELATSLAGVSGEELAHRAQKWLSLLGLQDMSQRLPGSLSGGQQQRASIARAMVKEPLVLVLDEPTSGLDDLNTEVISKAIKDYIGNTRICIISTHDHRLEKIADEIVDFNRFLPMERHLEALV